MIPIVMVTSGAPVETGQVNNLARPSGNVTGTTSITAMLSAKRLELFAESFPGLSRVGVFWNPGNADKVLEFRETVRAVRALGLQAVSIEVRHPDDLNAGFAAATTEHVEGLIVLPDPFTMLSAGRIAQWVAQNRLPAMGPGGLMYYGPNGPDQYRRAASYVDKILRGAKPADLPVEQPMRFDFVVNLKIAQALGLTIPQHVLLQATEIIQ